jgi:molecular chaperone DnaK (HSP70)
MVKEAEEFADEDAKIRETIDAKNGFESYVYGVKNAINDEKKAAKLSDEDKETVEAEVKKAQEWIEENPKASKEEFDETQKAMEKVVSPIMSKLYQGGKPSGDEGGSGGDSGGDDSDEL